MSLGNAKNNLTDSEFCFRSRKIVLSTETKGLLLSGYIRFESAKFHHIYKSSSQKKPPLYYDATLSRLEGMHLFVCTAITSDMPYLQVRGLFPLRPRQSCSILRFALAELPYSKTLAEYSTPRLIVTLIPSLYNYPQTLESEVLWVHWWIPPMMVFFAECWLPRQPRLDLASLLDQDPCFAAIHPRRQRLARTWDLSENSKFPTKLD